MSKRGYTHIVTIIDRSGSMSSIYNATLSGYNEFLAEQKNGEGEATLTAVQFGSSYEVTHSKLAIGEVPDLSNETYVLEGMTALLDAIGRTINSTEHDINALPEDERPENVTFCILTDGGENASREFTRDQVFEMINRHEEEDNWTFLFVGANQDAIQEGGNLGVRAGQTLSYAANCVGTQEVFRSLSKSVSKTRCCTDSDLRGLKTMGLFDEDDWEAQKNANAINDIDKGKSARTTLDIS